MKLLALHADSITFAPLKKALKQPEELSKERQGEITVDDDPLVALIAVESHDTEAMVEELVDHILDIARQVKAEKIVLYPYAHLSSRLGKPELALAVLEAAEQLIKGKGIAVWRAPFGYYKKFSVHVKGHPLSELSRTIGPKEALVETITPKKDDDSTFDLAKAVRSISKTTLDRSKLKENDHRILGSEMDLFSFNEVAPGMVFWHHNGLTVYNELVAYMREQLKQEHYREIRTPEILDKKLWLISGHWDKYKENIFISDYEGRAFASKPMNCPGGLMVYKHTPKTYKELPLRVAEFGLVHRQELSGVLAGLFRVIEFTQDDAHIFCSEEQIEDEVKNVIALMERVYKQFGFTYSVELSTRPEKRIGDEKLWDKAEKALEHVLKKNKMKYKLNPGDGAFYGPKIDFHLTDSLKRTWQCGTIQLDFSMPERFDLEYVDKEDGRKRPVMLHRAIFGSVERLLGILLEHTNGRLPTWLAPVQVRVLNFTDRNTPAAQKVKEQLENSIPHLRIEDDFRSTTMGAKVKDAELLRVPYIVTIGDKEEEAGTVAVRERGSKKLHSMQVEEFIAKLEKEISDRA